MHTSSKSQFHNHVKILAHRFLNGIHVPVSIFFHTFVIRVKQSSFRIASPADVYTGRCCCNSRFCLIIPVYYLFHSPSPPAVHVKAYRVVFSIIENILFAEYSLLITPAKVKRFTFSEVKKKSMSYQRSSCDVISSTWSLEIEFPADPSGIN